MTKGMKVARAEYKGCKECEDKVQRRGMKGSKAGHRRCKGRVQALADPGFGQGGPQKFFLRFANIVKQSQASEVSQYWLGSRACLRTLEALAF